MKHLQKNGADLTLAQSIRTSLQNIFKADFRPTVAEAFENGTAIRKAMRESPVETKRAIVTLIGATCRTIDANKTLQDAQEVVMTAEAITEDAPALRLEEFKVVCDGMMRGKYGKYYERLKTPEFLDAVHQYEGSRADYLTTRHQVQTESETHETARTVPPGYFTQLAKDLGLTKASPRNIREWYKSGPKLGPHEVNKIQREAIAEAERLEAAQAENNNPRESKKEAR